MKKRWVMIVLAFMLVLPSLLAGCADDSTTNVDIAEEDTTGTDKALTITLYAITGESTTPEAVQAVQDAMNEITEGTYNTHIILKLYTEDEYYGVIEEKFSNAVTKLAEEEAEAKRAKEEARSLKAAGITTEEPEETEETTAETEETVINEFGQGVTKYPEEEENQVDIFLVRGLGKLLEYNSKEYLLALDASMGSTGKALSKYIYPALLQAATLDTGVMAIPNNHMIGEYTYMLINRELADKYYYDGDSMTSLDKAEDFMADVKKYEPDYIPLYGEPYPLLDYITSDMAGSLVGGYTPSNIKQATALAPKNLLGNSAYTLALNQCYNYKAAGYLTSSNYEFNDKAAVQLVKGGYELREKYADDYYVQIYANPMATNDNVYESMYCVGAYTKNADRCVEIIAALTTDATLRNMFQYGVEKANYEIDDETGYVKILNSDYSMDMYDTGNQFVLWPNTDMSEDMLALSENNWYYAKQQNLEMVISPYVGYSLNYITQESLDAKAAASPNEDGSVTPISYSYMFTQDIIDGVIAASKEYLQKIADFKEYVDETTGNTVTYADYLKLLKTEFDANKYVAAFGDTENADSPLAQYTDWQTTKYPAPAM